jgi:hypothetical protein
MGYTPRQISVRAQETAWGLLSALDREGIVADFLDGYCKKFERPSANDQPAHYREMLATIKREALLEMVTFLEEEVPRQLGVLTREKVTSKPVKKGKKGKSKTKSRTPAQRPPRLLAADRQKIDLFRQEFFVGLGQVMEWRKEEFGEFWRDHEIYKKLNGQQNQEGTSRAKPALMSIGGPFVDRCALLLDPSLMDIARRAAADFREQLHLKTTGILKEVFTRKRDN